ncbi:hypothetical protein ACN9MB_04240 [Dyella kyungheensis]|uniref:hypothetical protein n=1 Tax=Dyella kyungheensis TaxID=1242174 RepID=UPI003CE86C0F
MTNYLGTGIFWSTLPTLAAILALATLVGRLCTEMLPFKLRGPAKFYLSPAMGLACFIVATSLCGRIRTLGDTIVIPLLFIVLLLVSLLRERSAKQALRHAGMVSVFGMVCGASVLAPLFVFGAFNAHNDAFTYLAHSNWLQTHAFGEHISATLQTPESSQIFIYQEMTFRMGGSYLLAALQALLNLRWAGDVYPALIISSLAACCLAIGFPLSKPLRPLSRPMRLALLTLPSFAVGGLVFGANFGFLPQSIGLALGAALLFLVGPLLRWIATTKTSVSAIAKASLACALLLAGTVYAYTEVVPFFVAATGCSALILAMRLRSWRNLSIFVGLAAGLSIILLNTELLRAYAALRVQTGAIVGSPVNWSLLGFVAHALGVHGGAWEPALQWSAPGGTGPHTIYLGLFLLAATMVILAFGAPAIWRAVKGSELLPTILVLMLFGAGFLYFRYMKPSPFPVGVGQSWSQFKLAEWANPFAITLVLTAFLSLRAKSSVFFRRLVVATFAIGFIGSSLMGIARTRPLMAAYNGVTNLNQFYRELRATVLSTCPPTAPVYLNLGGSDQKIRQMVTLYLSDRKLESDWSDDGYLLAIPPASNKEAPALGSCVVERRNIDGWLTGGAAIGPLQVGIFDGRGQIRIASTVGGYGRESDENNWWVWVQQKISFRLHSPLGAEPAPRTRVHFEYATRGRQTLTLTFNQIDGPSEKVLLNSDGTEEMAIFDREVDVSPAKLSEITIETNGTPSRLGENDPRMAAWVIRNVKIQPSAP